MKRMITLIPLLLAAQAGAALAADPIYKPPPPKEGHSYPECYCTNRGERVEMGQTSCLRIGNQEFTARCGMSLNNPAWRDKTPGCNQPVSQAPLRSEPLEPT